MTATIHPLRRTPRFRSYGHESEQQQRDRLKQNIRTYTLEAKRGPQGWETDER